MDAGELYSKREKSLIEKIKLNPDDITLRLEYALLLSGVSRDDEAVEQFNLALQRDPANPEVVAMLCRFFLSRDRTDEAIKLTDSALDGNPMESVLLKAHATALHSIGEYDAAIEELQLARQLMGDDPSLDYLLVECLIANGDSEEAESAARYHCMEYPDCTIRMHSAGRACWSREKYDEAEEFLKNALETIPNSLNVLLDLCGVLGDKSKHSEAIQLLLGKGDYFENSAEYYYALGNLYADEDQTDTAIKMYMKAIAINPGHFHALNNLALILQEREAPSEEVEKFFQRALDANPDDVYANLNYGNFLLGKGRREEAIPHYHKVVENEPWYIQARLSYAQTLLELGRSDEALVALKNLADDEELSYEEKSSLAQLYMKANQEELAERMLLEVIEASEGKSFTALEYLGDFLMEKGRVEEAIKLYLRAIIIEPSDVAIWIKAVGNLIDARNLFEVSASIERFLFEELPELITEVEEDELITVFKVLNEAIAANDPDRLYTFVEAAWEMRQPSLLAVLAKLYGFFGEEDEARRTFKEALSIAPGEVAIQREFIGWLISLDLYEEARDAILEAQEKLPDEPSLENDLALATFSMGDRAEAQKIFFSLSKRYPLDITYIYNYAWILFQNGMPDIALEVLEGYLERVAFDEQAAFFAAQIIAETRNRADLTKALGYLNLVLSNNERNHGAWALMAWIFQEKGEHRNASFAIRKALALAPEDKNVVLSASSLYLSVLQFPEATRWLEKCEELFPDDEDYLIEKARLFQAVGKYNASIEPLKRLFTMSPEKFGFSLACSLHYVGQIQEASKVASGLLRKESKVSASLSAGWYLFITGKQEQALEVALESVKDNAEVVDFRNLSIYLLAVGSTERAIEALKIFLTYVTQPLDVFFFLRDLDDYADRFPTQDADRFRLELTTKLTEMLRDYTGTSGEENG